MAKNLCIKLINTKSKQRSAVLIAEVRQRQSPQCRPRVLGDALGQSWAFSKAPASLESAHFRFQDGSERDETGLMQRPARTRYRTPKRDGIGDQGD